MKRALDEDIFRDNRTIIWKSGIAWGFLGLVLIGYLFTVLHYPGGDVLIAVFSGAHIGYSLVGFLSPGNKNPLNITFSLMGILWTIYLVIGVFLRNGRPFNFLGLLIYLGFLLLIALLFFIIHRRRKKHLPPT